MSRYRKICILLLVSVVFITGCSFNADKAALSFPRKTINNYVWAPEGGGTDQWNRIISDIMEEKLGQNIEVSNMTGGFGGIAVDYVWEQKHDGYKWVGTSETLLTMSVNGVHETTTKDWEYFIIVGSPGVIVVPKDSKYKTFEDLVNDAKENPNTVILSNSGIGGLWYIKANILAKYADIPFEFASYKGSRPAIEAALNGEVAAAVASTDEVLEFVKSGDMIPLITLENETYEFEGFGVVKSASEKYPQLKKYYPIDQWLGLKLPADTSKTVLNKIDKAFKAAIEDEVFKKSLEDSAVVFYGLSGIEAKEMVTKQESKMCWMLHDWGIAKISPEEVGIERP